MLNLWPFLRGVCLLILLHAPSVYPCVSDGLRAPENRMRNIVIHRSSEPFLHRLNNIFDSGAKGPKLMNRFRYGRDMFKVIIDKRRVEKNMTSERDETDLFDKNVAVDEETFTVHANVSSHSPSHTPASQPMDPLPLLDHDNETSILPSFSPIEDLSTTPTVGTFPSPTPQTSFTSQSIIPTILQSHPPSISPTITSFNEPTQSNPEFESGSPLASPHNSTNQSSTQNLRIPLQTIELKPFTILILADSSALETQHILLLSETHMTKTFDKLLKEQHFESVSLIITQENDIKPSLRKNRYIYDFHGEAYFRTTMKIDERKVHLARMRAFDTENMESFTTLLRDSGLNTSSVSMVTMDKSSDGPNDVDEGQHSSEQEEEKAMQGRSSGTSNLMETEVESDSFLVRIGSISFAIAGIAFIIGVLILYKMVKRMRDHINVETAVAFDSSVISQAGVESRTASDQYPFPTHHSIYRIEEEESHSQEDDDRC